MWSHFHFHLRLCSKANSISSLFDVWLIDGERPWTSIWVGSLVADANIACKWAQPWRHIDSRYPTLTHAYTHTQVLYHYRTNCKSEFQLLTCAIFCILKSKNFRVVLPKKKKENKERRKLFRCYNSLELHSPNERALLKVCILLMFIQKLTLINKEKSNSFLSSHPIKNLPINMAYMYVCPWDWLSTTFDILMSRN